jgi:hypothetical protein
LCYTNFSQATVTFRLTYKMDSNIKTCISKLKRGNANWVELAQNLFIYALFVTMRNFFNGHIGLWTW